MSFQATKLLEICDISNRNTHTLAQAANSLLGTKRKCQKTVRAPGETEGVGVWSEGVWRAWSGRGWLCRPADCFSCASAGPFSLPSIASPHPPTPWGLRHPSGGRQLLEKRVPH